MTNNLETSCYADTSFEIRVFEMPVLNSPPFILERCDDDFDGFYSFNLTEINSEIVSSITTEVFTYYESSAEAEAGIVGTEITNPTTYVNEVVNTDNTLWVRIESADGCYRTTQVTLIVKPSAIPTSFLRTFSECDDGTDNGDGIATFDFSSVTAEVQAMFPTAVDVFYYKNQVDATAELNEIIDTSAYQNTDSPNTQEIWVRAVSQLGNDCLGSGDHIKLIVEKLPIANKPNDLTECDDDGDGEFSFDTTIVEAEILNSQSLADVTITYFNEVGTMIGTSLPNPFLTASQTIDIVIINNISNDPEGACTDNTTLEFVVGNSVEAATVLMTSSCDDDGDGISVFDTLNLESDILNGQLGMNVYYFNALGDPLIDSNGVVITSPFPSSFSTNTQTITVAIENPVNTTCIATTTVDFTVLSNPVYDLEEETLICENQLPHTISVENPNQSNYIYQWFDPLGVELGIDQTLIITNSDNLTSEGIEYKVTVTNPSTNCSKTKSILVKASLLPMIAEDDIITVEFNSPGNSIEINTTNLGAGDYEFSLEHDYDYQPFQDEPIFKGLLGGIYTLLVNDKNGCGETKLTIVILDYPKFLTPNNDGQNDTWKLVGIEFTSFTISPIQIFDRFGKIVAVIDPLSQGWDGYYNGTQLPASDYWFRVQLTDPEGTILDKKGHFSLVRR
jgi:gliding motility-associated-like protein